MTYRGYVRLVGSVTLLALIAAASAAVSSLRNEEIPVIEQPAAWVPFEATVEVSKPAYPRAVGRFYRSDDGSTRLETGPEDGTVNIVSIKNIARATIYVKSTTGQWVSHPMKLPTGGYRPAKMRVATVGLSQFPFKLALQKGQNGSLRSNSAGLDAYHYVTPSGNVWLMVPSLNFFPVLQETLEGRRELYSNIVVGGQPAELFEPPPGAVITVNTRPAGIVEQPVDTGVHALPGQHPSH